jgi:hypothetical protein
MTAPSLDGPHCFGGAGFAVFEVNVPGPGEATYEKPN